MRQLNPDLIKEEDKPRLIELVEKGNKLALVQYANKTGVFNGHKFCFCSNDIPFVYESFVEWKEGI